MSLVYKREPDPYIEIKKSIIDEFQIKSPEDKIYFELAINVLVGYGVNFVIACNIVYAKLCVGYSLSNILDVIQLAIFRAKEYDAVK